MKVLRSQKKFPLQLSEIKTDNQWSLFCRDRDKHHCRIGLKGCTKKAIEVHHVFTRGLVKLRLNPLNGLSICRNCHNKLENDPLLNFNVCRKVLGEENFEILHELYVKETKINAKEHFKNIEQSRKK